LVLIAQAPGYTEDKEGRMFVGPSGKKLDELFVEVGARANCTNMAYLWHQQNFSLQKYSENKNSKHP